MNPNNYLQRVARSASTFSNFDGGMGGNLSQLNRTLTVVITNATSVASSYTLFGFNQYGTDGTQGTGVTVTINETSYNQVLRETANTPYQFVSAKYNTTSSTNLSYVVTYSVTDATGMLVSKKFTPLTYQEPENNNTSLVRIPDFNGVTLDGQTILSASIAASSTITYILTLAAKANLANSLDGGNVIVTAGQPAPNGMSPVQLVIAPTSPSYAASANTGSIGGAVANSAPSRFY